MRLQLVQLVLIYGFAINSALGQEPVPLSKEQAGIFSTDATKLRNERINAARDVCVPGGGMPGAVFKVLDFAGGLLKDTRSRFAATKHTPAQLSATDDLFDGLARQNNEVQAAAHSLPPEECAEVRAYALGTVFIHEAVYTSVANRQQATFDLRVESVPSGASISIGREGDSKLQKNPSPTSTTIVGLHYAIWFIRLERSGFKPAQREFNPFRERVLALFVEMKK